MHSAWKHLDNWTYLRIYTVNVVNSVKFDFLCFRKSPNDQENLYRMVQEWKQVPDDSFFFRP